MNHQRSPQALAVGEVTRTVKRKRVWNGHIITKRGEQRGLSHIHNGVEISFTPAYDIYIQDLRKKVMTKKLFSKINV